MRPSFFREYGFEIAIVVVGAAAVNAIFIAKAFRQSTAVDPEAAAQLGSFVGGYVGSLFALVSVVLLYVTLKHQRLASAKENFETKYFELLKMHRDNVAEIGLRNGSGRRVFVLLVRELRSALELIRQVAQLLNQPLSQRELLHISYYCLFFGVGPNSSRMLKLSLSNFNEDFVDAIAELLDNAETKQTVSRGAKLGYKPFQGHQSRLGHYYRHLYQMVRYVDQQPPSLKINKYEYVKTIRAQLSTHEQALLLVNSLTPIGCNWWVKSLIDKYRLVQNLPQEFFDRTTELDTGNCFRAGYFEWEDVAH